jgi:hypothetical protein
MGVMSATTPSCVRLTGFGCLLAVGLFWAAAASAADLEVGGLLAPLDPAALAAEAAPEERPAAGLQTFGFTPRQNLPGLVADPGGQLGTSNLTIDLGRAGQRSDERRAVSMSGTVAGLPADIGTQARLVEQGDSALGDGQVYQFKGSIGLSDFRIGAAFERTETAFTGGETVGADLAYNLGRFTTRVGMQRLAPDLSTGVDVYSLGADFALRPNLVIGGGLAVTDPELGEPSTAGLLGLRWRF